MKFSFPFFLVIFIFNINCSFSQNKIDVSPDSLYILSKNKNLSLQQRLDYINQALLSNETDSKKLKYKSLKSAIYSNNDEYKNAINEAYKLLKKSKVLKDTLYVAKAYYKLGLYYNNTNVKDSSYLNFYNSKKWYLLINDTIGVAKSLKNLSDINRINGDFYSAEKLAVEGLELIGGKSKELSYNLYMLLGICSNNLEDFSSAKNWYSEALKTAISKKDSALTYNSFGVFNIKQKNYNKALQFFDLALKDNLKKDLKLKIEDNKAFTKGLLNNKNAVNTIDSIRKEKLKNKNVIGAFASNIHLTKLYLKQNNLKQAEVNAEAAFKIANQLNSADSKIESLGFLIDLKKNNSKEAKLYKHIVDSVNRAKTKLKSTIDKIEFETLEKEKENLVLQSEKAEQAQELATESKRKWLLFYGLIALLIGTVIFGFYYKRNLKQKKEIEALQKELHHRIKNNLAIIHRFVEVTKEDVENPKLENKLSELENRIESISYVHELLYKSNNLTTINLKKYIDSLVTNIAYSFPEHNIKIIQNIEAELDINTDKSFPIGLILNEFITNSFKYAYNDNEGQINVSLKKIDKNYTLAIQDNGKGIPEDLDLDSLNSFGIRIMKLLSQQLKGTFTLENKNGTLLTITIPIN